MFDTSAFLAAPTSDAFVFELCFFLGEKRKIMRQKFAPQCLTPRLFWLHQLLTLLFSFFASNPSPGRKTQNNASEVRAQCFDTPRLFFRLSRGPQCYDKCFDSLAFLAAPTSDAFVFVFCF